MALQDKFEVPIAYDPTGGIDGQGELVKGAVFTVHAVDDTSFSTPLAVTDPASGVPISPLQSSAVTGVLPDFRVAGDLPEVLLRSGSFVTRLTSKFGTFVQAGWDPTLAQAAASAAPVAVQAAQEARDAADAAMAVPVTNDGIMTTVAQNASSAFATELRGAFALATRVRRVEEFLLPGEVLDTTGATSVHAVFQRAVTALGAEYAANAGGAFGTIGYQVVWPAGKYRLDQTTTARSGVAVGGAGMNETTFYPQGAAVFLKGVGGAVWDGTEYDDMTFTGFTVDGIYQSTASYDSSVKGIYIQHMNRVVFDRVRIQNAGATGFGVDFLDNALFVNCVARNNGRLARLFNNPRFNTGAGFGIGVGYKPVERVKIVNCESDGNWSHGYFWERLNRPEAKHNPMGLQLVNSSGSHNWDGFLDAGGCGAITTGCTFTDNDFAGITLNGTGAAQTGGYDGVVTATVVSRNGGNANPNTTGGVTLNGGGGIVARHASQGGYTFDGVTSIYNYGPGLWTAPGSLTAFGKRILGGTYSHNTGPGVLVEGADAAGFILEDAVIEDNGTDVASTYRDGVTVRASLIDAHIHRLKSKGNAGRGLAFRGAGTAIAPQISDNDLRGNVQGSLLVDHTVADASGITRNLLEQLATVEQLVTNPSLELDDAGWEAQNGAFVRATSGGRYGPACYTGPSSSGTYRVRAPLTTVTPGTVITGSIWVKAKEGVSVFARADFAPSGQTQVKGAYARGTGEYQRVTVTCVVPATATGVRIAGCVEDGAAGDTFTADGANITTGPRVWPYIDGAQPDCMWQGTAGASKSTWFPNGGIPTPFLDTVTSYAAYGLYRLRTAYTGAAVRVRRSTDNAEVDIGFTGTGALDETALTGWLAGASGYVVTLYDQSGNTRNLTQATAAAQPRIANAGVIEQINSHPAIRFDGVDDTLSGATGLWAATASGVTVAAVIAGTANATTYVLSESNSGANQHWSVGTAADKLASILRTGSTVLANPIGTRAAVDTSGRQVTWLDTGAALTLRDSGVTDTTAAYTRPGALTLNAYHLGSRRGTEAFYSGRLAQLVIIPGAPTAGVYEAVEAAQKQHYATT